MGSKGSKKDDSFSQFDILKQFANSPEGRRSFLLVQNARPSCYKGIDVSKEWLLLDLDECLAAPAPSKREWIVIRRQEADVWIGLVHVVSVNPILDFMNQHGLWEAITLADSAGHAASDEDYLGIGLSFMAFRKGADGSSSGDHEELMTMYFPHGEPDISYGDPKKHSAPDELKEKYQQLVSMIQILVQEHAVDLRKPLYKEYSSFIMPQEALNWVQSTLFRQQHGGT